MTVYQRLVDGELVDLTPEEIAELNAAPTRAELIAYAADVRWRKETGGISIGGVPVATDDRSKQMIMGARIAADASTDFTTPWVGTDGQVYPLSAAQVIAISSAVLAHVSVCFSIFASVKSGIVDGIVTTFAEIDESFET